MSSRSLKILVTGNSGLGKTELAAALVRENIVDHHVAEGFASVMAINRSSRDGRKKAALQSAAWINQRIKILKEENSFVMDRGPIDMLYFWLSSRLVEADFWLECAEKVRRAMSSLDLVVLAPASSRFQGNQVSARNEDGIARNMGGYPDICNQTTIYGLCYQLIPVEKIYVLPDHPISTDERVRLLKAVLCER